MVLDKHSQSLLIFVLLAYKEFYGGQNARFFDRATGKNGQGESRVYFSSSNGSNLGSSLATAFNRRLFFTYTTERVT